ASTDCNDECMYNRGDIMSARHILIMASDGTIPSAGPAVTPEQRAVAKKKAEAIKAQATPANFVKLTEKSEEPQAKERGGDLGLFSKGGMVKPFEQGVLATKPGSVSDIVQSAFGYHIIYRPTYAEVKDKVENALKDRPIAIAESTYLAHIDSTAEIKFDNNVAIKIKAIARNPLGYAKDNSTIADYKGGKFTASRLADWITAWPPQYNIRQALQQPNLPDSLVTDFARRLIHNEVLLQKADSAKIEVDTAEMANLRLRFHQNLASAWGPLGVDGAKLDSAKSTGDREKLAAQHVNAYFDKLIKNEAPFVDIPYPIARAVQKKFDFAINDAALDKAVEKAKSVRATADSLRAKQGPPMPGAAAGAPPAGATPPPAKPPAPVKKP
ncbi:MAG: peptidylprolyl isomerase, partial [Gemmatimonadota bacterium]|nr:peptidylprolyl isomerase [Gemmatimonadota bacterium]